MASDINNIIDNSWKFRMSKVIQLLHWMAMWMENTRVLVCYNFIDFSFNIFDELKIFDWRISRDFFLSLWSGVNIDSDSVFDPFFKLGHFLSRKLISASWNMNASVIIQNKLCIFESPSVIFEPLLFVFNILGSFDVLFFQEGLQVSKSLHWGKMLF